MNTYQKSILAISTIIYAACPSNPNPATSATESETDPTGIASIDKTTSDSGMQVCIPNEVECINDKTIRQCNADGSEVTEIACEEQEKCIDGECLNICQQNASTPSSEGCSFIANRMLHYNSALPPNPEEEIKPDGLIVGNRYEQTANVTLFQMNGFVPNPIETIELATNTSHTFALTEPHIGTSTALRFGRNYYVVSDVPIAAYQYSPIQSVATNDASMLLPDSTLRSEYIITSYSPFGNDGSGGPSYFYVVALEDDTILEWIPSIDTAKDVTGVVPAVKKGEVGKVKINRFTNLQIAASNVFLENNQIIPVKERDLSGTVVRGVSGNGTPKPIMVMGATRCAFVPFADPGIGWCDHLQEMMIPVDYWGRNYVGAHSPVRSVEDHIWRIFAGQDNVTVNIESDLPIEPIVLANKGDWQEVVLPTGTNVIFSSSKKFLPVQYLVGSQYNKEKPGWSDKLGDPSMVQMVPIEQFQSKYVFFTGEKFDIHYVQVIRNKGGADIFVDNGELVTGYEPIGDFEVANWEVSEGPHVIESSDDFGIINYGYCLGIGCQNASYAYPGGLKLELIPEN